MNKIKNIIEAILFVSGEKVNINDLSKVLNISTNEIKNILLELKDEKYNENSGIILNFMDNYVNLTTNDNYYNYISDFFNFDKKKELTKAAMEVLSIIAYKQPVTKSEIDNIRGVKSDHIIQKLINDEFIIVSGKLDSPGLPNLYKTTEKFLLKFNISDLKDLPEINIEDVKIWDYKSI